MLTPISWLKEFVALPPLPKLVDRLNETGTTVAEVSEYGTGLETIIVGQITEVVPHPNADKLQLATVKVPGKTLSIVCGAKNIEAGQKVPVAQVGTSVPYGPDNIPMNIARIKIRDVESQGMLCSGKELGLGSDHSGILILDPETPIGTKLTSSLKLPETILETEVTTNRGDELSVYGLAREIAAVTTAKLKPLTAKPIALGQERYPLSVKIEDPKLTRRYTAVTLTNLKIGPSPSFIKMRLSESGMRPINNVVDITNYVMLLTGQPLHAFDYSKVAGGKIIVRESRAGERLTALDGVTRVLSFGSIVIADSEKILGLGGVMGGEESGVTDLTDTIVLESAIFDPFAIRQTAVRFNLRSEASHRFERGVDVEGTRRALGLATELFQKYAEGEISSEVVDIYPAPFQPAEVTLTSLKLTQYLGYELPLLTAEKILSRLGFKLVRKNKGAIVVSVPSYRAQDVSLEEDLIEEVARIEGYGQIPEVIPPGTINPLQPNTKILAIKGVKEHLVSQGLSEVQPYTMVSEDIARDESALKIANSISRDWEFMRTSLIPGLAQTAATNVNLGSEPKIFELAKIYQPKEGDLPYEKYELGLVGASFAEVKGYFESSLAKLGLGSVTYEPCESDLLNPGTSASVRIGSEVVGQIGALSPAIKTKVGLRRTLYFGEFDFETLVEKIPTAKPFRIVPKYPAVTEDLSILVGLETPIVDITSAVSSAGAKDLAAVEPVDVFADEKLGQGKKSVTITLIFQSKEKTLTDQEVKLEREKIEKSLKEKLQAKIR